MMPRRRIWQFAPGETRDLGASFDSELDSAAVLTGTPTVSAWTLNAAGTFTAAAGLEFSQEQVNTEEQTADGGEVIAIGRGVFFRVAALATLGRYYIRTECDADDGTHPVRGDEPYDLLIVSGPPAVS
jgi:hypothetical protein